MTGHALRIDVEPHPLLRPVAFTTAFPRPLGELATPSWVLDLLDLHAEAPVQRDDARRTRIRDMLRVWGHKPAGRGKPASEYLVRAVGEGRLDSINLAVDICNVVSLHSGFPIALVDLARSRPPFRVAPGPEDGRYVFNAAGQEMSLKGLICLFDAEGPCGNPVKDAQRVKTGDSTLETLTVLWGVAGHEEAREAAMAWYRGLLERAGGETRPVTVIQGAPDPPV
ncbi:MAG: phenylalanine--tRNA ligase beta subunit-related protein [Longimicrobiales bacterium]